MAAVAAISLVLGVSPLAAQDDSGAVSLTRPEARSIAVQALRGGRPDVAARIVAGLLTADPGDAQALLILAALKRGSGDLDGARETATRAWRAAESPAARFEAAFFSAEVAAQQERWTSAQIWLRRADHNAPSPAATEAVARAYGQVSARNPLSVQLSFSVKPSDNLNNGFDPDTTIVIGGIPFSPETKVGGFEVSASAALTYRFSESERQKTEAIAQVYLRRAIIDSDDFATFNAGPNQITRNEFDYASLAFGLKHTRRIFDDLGPTAVSGTLGAAYYRNAHLSNFAELAVSQDLPQGDDGLLRLGAALRDETRFDSPASSFRSQAISADWLGRTGGGVVYSIGATVTNYDSIGLTTKGEQLATRARLSFTEAYAGATPDLGLGLTIRDLPEAGFGAGRVDRTARATLGLTFNDLTFYGFVPRVEFSASDTNSTDPAYDRGTFGVGATLISRF